LLTCVKRWRSRLPYRVAPPKPSLRRAKAPGTLVTPGDEPTTTQFKTPAQGPVGDVFTIGHSTHTLPAFTTLLRRNRIEQVIDVRTLPRSRRNPQFDIDAIQPALRAEGFRYTHLPEVGGLRQPVEESVNDGWDNEAFRG